MFYEYKCTDIFIYIIPTDWLENVTRANISAVLKGIGIRIGIPSNALIVVSVIKSPPTMWWRLIVLVLSIVAIIILLLSLHPLCGGGDLLFLLSPPAAAATCFCSHLTTPTRIISKY